MRNRWRLGDGEGRPLGRHSANGHGAHRVNGIRPRGMRTQAVPLDEVDIGPTDLAALHADEELISALATGRNLPRSSSSDTDDRLVGMLQAWRAEVDAEPIRPLLTVEQASEAIRRSRVAERRRLLMPVASAAAILAVLLSGLVIGAHDARPGDPLWAVSKVLYQERAASVEAAVDVEAKLEKAKDAMAHGRTEDAGKELAAAGSGLDEVRSAEGKEVLANRQQDLSVKLKSAAPGQPIDVEEPATSASSVIPSTSKETPSPSVSPVLPTIPSPQPSGGSPQPPSSAG